jgi:hypothetical protein
MNTFKSFSDKTELDFSGIVALERVKERLIIKSILHQSAKNLNSCIVLGIFKSGHLVF